MNDLQREMLARMLMEQGQAPGIDPQAAAGGPGPMAGGALPAGVPADLTPEQLALLQNAMATFGVQQG